jgi:GT2 family glycosyltransferase
MNCSVVICTYNRFESLRRTLNSLAGLDLPADVRWELVVVNNNCTDATEAVCGEFSGRLPLRHVVERQQGLNTARNRGVREATSNLVAFTDDDVEVDPVWLGKLWLAARGHPDATFFGGNIMPRWEVPPPRWLARNSRILLAGPCVHLERDNEERFLRDGEWPFFGANMAFRRSVFEAGHWFREDLGQVGNSPNRQEETEFMRRIMGAGYRGFYVPGAVIHHHNPASRMTERYIREWFKGAGMSDVRLGFVSRATGLAWGSLLANGLRYALMRPLASHRTWLRAEIEMARAWGMICESRRSGRPK